MANGLFTSNHDWANEFTAHLSADLGSSDTDIFLDTVPTPSEGCLVIDPDTPANTEIILYTSKTSSKVTVPSVANGRGYDSTTATTHTSGTKVIMAPIADDFRYIRTLATANATYLAAGGGFDFVASGCVWTADAAGSTLNASMTTGTVYIAGSPVTVATITAHNFTASKDTYVDVGATGTVTYTAVNNNAASPALAASSIRLAIIVSGASNIAAAASINQGQEDRVLPIASSIAYSVTDSLGNLICPRDPSRRVLGYRQILSNATATQAPTQITGLSCPVIVPTGRKIKVSVFTYSLSSNASNVVSITIWDGTVGTTKVGGGDGPNTANVGSCVNAQTTLTPTSASKTYNAALNVVTSGTANFSAASTVPGYIQVELV